jgi:hypothetical protein
MKIFTFALMAACSFATLAVAGPEQYSGKEMKQTVAPVAVPEWYGDHEWNVGVWGTYVWAGNGPFGRDNLPSNIPDGAAPDLGLNGNGVDLRSHHGDSYLGASDAWGGGVDLKYFICRYFGIGVEGYGLAVHRDKPEVPKETVAFGHSDKPVDLHDEDLGIGSGLGTFTIRFPIGRFAPYVFAGGGGIFGGGDIERVKVSPIRRGGNGETYGEVSYGDDSSKAVAQVGGGLEFRFTRHIGVMSDVSWNIVDGPNNNFGMVRSGLNFAF